MFPCMVEYSIAFFSDFRMINGARAAGGKIEEMYSS